MDTGFLLIQLFSVREFHCLMVLRTKSSSSYWQLINSNVESRNWTTWYIVY